MIQNIPKKRKPLGLPLIRTDAELEAMSIVTPAMIEAAKVWAQSNAPAVSKLLDAKQVYNDPSKP
jgi:hypothetical protein